MGSLIDDYDLSKPEAKDRYEELVAVGTSLKDCALCFGVDYDTMKGKVVEWYHHPQAEFTHERLRGVALNRYLQTLTRLAHAGSPSAMATLNQYAYRMSGQEDKALKIEFVCSVPKETEADKETDK